MQSDVKALLDPLLWTQPQINQMLKAVWPLALMSAQHPEYRKHLYAHIRPLGPPLVGLGDSGDELGLLHGLLLCDLDLFATRLQTLIKRPWLSSIPQYWHPTTQFGGAGRGQDLPALFSGLLLMGRCWAADEDDQLWLFPIAPTFGFARDWVFKGKGLGHRFGTMNLWAHVDRHGTYELDMEQHYVTVPKDIKLRLPMPTQRVEVDGKVAAVEQQILRLGPRAQKIRILFTPAAPAKISQTLE
jgi:hypothetical protein